MGRWKNAIPMRPAGFALVNGERREIFDGACCNYCGGNGKWFRFANILRCLYCFHPPGHGERIESRHIIRFERVNRGLIRHMK